MSAMNLRSDAEAVQVRRIVARVRRILSETPQGISRSNLRRKLNSREKHLYDDALDLLLAVGDIETVPAYMGGVRYRLCQSPVVAPAHDSVTTPSQPSMNTRDGGRGESTREPREVQGDATECAS